MRAALRPVVVALLAAVSAGPALAQGTPIPTTLEQVQALQRACEAKKPQRKSAGTISESTYRRLERVIDQISKNEYGEAEAKLKEMQAASRGGYEKAVISQTLAFVYASTNRNALAIKAFETAIGENAMPQQPHEQMVLNVAQLYMADNQAEKGIKFLNEYMNEACNPLPDAHIMLASAYAEKKRWRDALTHTDLALLKSKEPKEQWLQLKLALHFELKELPKCAEVLVQLVGIAPIKETYWKQLSSILFELRKDPEALATLALAERRGYIDEEAEFRNIANLYMYLQIPYKAATFLQRGVDQKIVPPTEKNLEFLGNAWLAAREYKKAQVAMRAAAEASDKGELWKRLGQIYVEDEQWKQASEALAKARQKGVKEPGELAFLTGVVAVELKQWKAAESALREAMQHDKTAKVATQWLAHLQAEMAYNAQTAPATPEAPAQN